MQESILPQASLFLGIIPALLLLWISLKGYDKLYEDKNLYLSFLGGLIVALIASIIELNTLAPGIIIPLIWIIIELFFKTVLLNLPRLHKKKETVIYGLGLGLGFGAMYVPFSLGTISSTGQTTFTIAILILGSMTYVPLHGATGVLIGYGVYERRLTKYFLLAFLASIPMIAWYLITSYIGMPELQLLLLIYSFILYWYITTRYMPRILTERKRAN